MGGDRQRAKVVEGSSGWIIVNQEDCNMSCSESGSDDIPLGAQGDLASRTLVLESKRFYLDVKENQRGRFIKIAEISADGRKNQILMTFSTAGVFSQNLLKFIEFYEDIGDLDPDNLKQGELRSEVMNKNDKKYHMDLKENARGRFLKVSETFSARNFRSQVFIPAEAMEELQQHLSELIDEHDDGIEDSGEDSYHERGDGGKGFSGRGGHAGGRGGREDSKQVRIENKNFYFDVKTNAQGCYMSISEVNGSHRNSILIPQSGWHAFRAALDDTVATNDF